MAGKSRTRSARKGGRKADPTAGRIRIIAGRLRGRLLEVPSARALRPTPNRVRETLFNWLQHEIPGARCLDLFAGSGALGIEALSRGAAELTFVESDARIAAILESQLRRFDLTATVVCASAQAFLERTSAQFDIVFADPPFDFDAAPACRAADKVLRPGGALYCERAATDTLPELEWARWQHDQRAGGVRFGLARAISRD